jgi:hypothetical protein
MEEYFDFMKSLCCMLAFYTLVLSPIMGMYSSYDALAARSAGFITRYSLGNMGSSSTTCD